MDGWIAVDHESGRRARRSRPQLFGCPSGAAAARGAARLAGDVRRPQLPGELVVLECGRQREGLGDAGDEVGGLGEHALAPRVELGLVGHGGAGAGGLDAPGDEAVVLHALPDALLGDVDALGFFERGPDALDAVVRMLGFQIPAADGFSMTKIKANCKTSFRSCSSVFVCITIAHLIAASRSSAETGAPLDTSPSAGGSAAAPSVPSAPPADDNPLSCMHFLTRFSDTSMHSLRASQIRFIP